VSPDCNISCVINDPSAESPFDFSVYRLFQAGQNATDISGLDLSEFQRFYARRRAAEGPFRGAAAEKLNEAEAFYHDAIGSIRRKALVVPSPFGRAELSTADVLVSPGEPWPSVPLFAYRFSTQETFYFLKRGLSWCMDLGLFFPARRLLVSFQQEERRLVQDRVDVRHALRFFAEHRDDRRDPASISPKPASVIVNSDHFAHHLWNELSVVEGIVAEGLHHDVLMLVSQAPLASLSELFPEIPRERIVDVGTSVDAAHLYAMRRGLFVAPTGRRFVPQELIDRILARARATFVDEARRAAAFRMGHDPVVWITVRVDARTAVNLVAAVARVVEILLQRFPRMGVVFDGFTRPSTATAEWCRNLIDDERRAVASITSRVGTPFDHATLCGKFTMEAFLWAEIADYYICPHGTAQHKVAWINPIPGTVHVGDNKRPMAAFDPAYHARNRGAVPAFCYGRVVRNDSRPSDRRLDLVSYELDVDAFATAVDAHIRSSGTRRFR
jgi:hypothetical protein